MTGNEQALLAQMQDLGYSHGLCLTAIQILSQSKQAVSDMLSYISMMNRRTKQEQSQARLNYALQEGGRP